MWDGFYILIYIYTGRPLMINVHDQKKDSSIVIELSCVTSSVGVGGILDLRIGGNWIG